MCLEDAAASLLASLLCALAISRLTRVVVADTITEPLRAGIRERFGVTSMATTLAHCGWCVGWWMSCLVVPLAWMAGLYPSPLAALIGVPASAYLAAGVIRAIERGE